MKKDGDYIANEVIMQRNAFIGSIIIVEGNRDVSTYKYFMHDGKENKVIPANGKQNALDAIKILDDDKIKGVLAIVDADFSNRKEIKSVSNNIIFTDCHDLEMMIVRSNSFKKKIEEKLFSRADLKEFLNKANQRELRILIMENILPISCLREMSARDNLKISFEGLRFKKFIDSQTLTLDKEKFISSLMSQNVDIFKCKKKLLKDLECLETSQHGDLYLTCRGHDFMQVLLIGIKNIFGENICKHYSIGDLEEFVRISYDSADFKTTEMYKMAKLWERRNKPYKIFK